MLALSKNLPFSIDIFVTSYSKNFFFCKDNPGNNVTCTVVIIFIIIVNMLINSLKYLLLTEIPHGWLRHPFNIKKISLLFKKS